MAPSGRLPRGTLGLRLKVVLALYVLAAALMPLAHHDLLCHLKSTTHCTTCTVGSSAEAAADPALLARFWLLDIGATVCDPVSAPESATLRPSSGRAPPVIA
ncbi:MAG: hypothetical protein ABI818_07480 [Acidobacteriota bacterium]